MMVAKNANIPWEELYDLILSCGNVHDPYGFAVAILSGLKKLCSFDQALIYFLDGNGKISNQYLMDIDEQWSNLYLGYYSTVDSRHYKTISEVRETPGQPLVGIATWDQEPDSEFISDYIRPRGLKCSLGFVLFDMNGLPRTIFALDKTREDRFSEAELAVLSLAIPQLNNLHKNFYSRPTDRLGSGQNLWGNTNLTAREVEVANLLCRGVSPANISKALHITQSTAYKHIANIYKKMQVSTRQELLVRLLD